MDQPRDGDPLETREWLDSVEGVLEVGGPERLHFLLEQVVEGARRRGAPVPYSANTAYLNTIPVERQPAHPGDRAVEHRIRSAIRWNAARHRAQGEQGILRARRPYRELPVGGHALRHRLHAFLARRDRDAHGGDLIYVQGHSSPGIYARAFLEGRLTEEQLVNFRQEVGGKGLVLLPASLADAGFLAVPDRLDGPRSPDGDLSGALSASYLH